MERKRDGPVPTGEGFNELNGPEEKALQLAPQARHHFTQADQVNQLVGASEANPDLGFMARLLMLCNLPRTNPGARHQYKRVNGPYTLIMFSSGKTKLPFGNLPRLLLAWVCTEAVRTQKRELVLGASLAEFMRKLGVYSTSGGTTGGRTRLRNQMKRLFNAHIQLVYEDKQAEVSVNSPIASRTEFWWNERNPDEPVLFNSKIRIGEDFFNEIIRRPVPLDMNILKAIKRSPLGLDLYLWVAYRTFALERPLRISWRQLYRQFGAEPSKASNHYTVKDFRRKVLRELVKIKAAWPDLNYTIPRGCLELRPSKSAVPTARLLQLAE